jgi:hypothetical protein
MKTKHVIIAILAALSLHPCHAQETGNNKNALVEAHLEAVAPITSPHGKTIDKLRRDLQEAIFALPKHGMQDHTVEVFKAVKPSLYYEKVLVKWRESLNCLRDAEELYALVPADADQQKARTRLALMYVATLIASVDVLDYPRGLAEQGNLEAILKPAVYKARRVVEAFYQHQIPRTSELDLEFAKKLGLMTALPSSQ